MHPHGPGTQMQNQGHSSRTRILHGRSNKLLENKFYSVYRLIQFKLLRTLILRKGDVVISTKIEFTFFRLASFVKKLNDKYFLSCQSAHKDNKCQWLFIGLHRGVIVPRQAIHRLPFLMSLQDVNYPKSNSHLFNITISSHVQRHFSSIHTLYKY